MDTLTPAQRSERMSRIRGKGSKPEIAVRKLIHGLGFRYRLHARELPGKPDLVFRKKRKAIFVHGCFWHRHEGCALARLPKSRHDFWLPKLGRNRERDVANEAALNAAGWKQLVIWECELKDLTKVQGRVVRFLGKGTD